MRMMVVDDEDLAVESLVRLLQKEQPEAEIISYTRPIKAFAYLGENSVDIAFLDIEMGGFTGLSLAERCKELCPTVNIIFVTGYSQYALDAMRLHASGYLMKPVRSEDLRTELANLRHPQPRHRVRIQTFGNFEVFVDGKPLWVPRTKCKECLAYLVDRKGAGVAFSQLTAVLWEGQPIDRSAQKNTHKVISDLIKTLREVGVENILCKTHTDIAIHTTEVDCDYFSVINGDLSGLDGFMGEYMTNYSWAEFTLGELITMKKRNRK